MINPLQMMFDFGTDAGAVNKPRNPVKKIIKSILSKDNDDFGFDINEAEKASYHHEYWEFRCPITGLKIAKNRGE